MHKSNYILMLSIIEDITGSGRKFDFDKVLDGSYNFNVSDVSLVYDLVHSIEELAESNGSLKSTQQGQTLLKEFRYQFKKVIYEVSRFYNTDESTVINRIALPENEPFVSEQELMHRIDEKCTSIRKMLNSVYGEKPETVN